MENSHIEWCDNTFNPWIGCSKVSPACDNCYAEEMMGNRYKRVEWGLKGTRSRTSPDYWRKPLAWNRAAEKTGVRYRIFCASLADVFEGDPGQNWGLSEWRDDLFALILATPNLDWLLLTKRPAKAAKFFRENAVKDIITRTDYVNRYPKAVADIPENWPLPNVWIGTSVEDQQRALERIQDLLAVPATVRFLSCEPLLGPVELCEGIDQIDWVIAGGESGPRARPMNPEWVRSLRDQCTAENIPFLFKQWGCWAPSSSDSKRGCKRVTINCVDGDPVEMVRGSKIAAGRLLDGREWSEFPKVTSA